MLARIASRPPQRCSSITASMAPIIPSKRSISSSHPSKKPTLTTPSSTSSKPLYASQSTIPHLPIPSLSSTLSKYTETLLPLQSPSAHSSSKSKIQEFQNSEFAKVLQGRLEARAKEKDSWLSEWWNDVAYMGFRGRIVPYVNYFYIHKRGLGKGKNQEDRASELIRAIVEFKKLVISEVLEPEKGKAGPLCMASYKYLFNAVRVPTSPADIPLAYPPHENHHIVVLRKNRLFKVDTEGRSASEITKALKQVKEVADKSEPGPNVGVLCADDRDVWTEFRRHLMSLSKENTKSIQTVESAILLVCLDDGKPPSSEDERAWSYWSGSLSPAPDHQGYNRWFDKHNLIIDEAGESGFNGEHSMLDGTPTLRLNDFMLAAVDQGKIPLELPENEKNTTPMPQPEEIVFELDDKLKRGIEESRKGFGKEMSLQDLKMVVFTGYGKNAIKTHKASPDAWVQLIKQLAFYRQKNRPGVTYESCQTRKFLLGRTEVIRSCSKEAIDWVQSMLNSSASDKEREELFRKAVTRHIQYSTWAADAQGVDRHLFGLKQLIKKDEEVPEMYKDEIFGKSNHWEMSTSQLSSKWLDGWGYGEVVDDGYGLSYAIEDDAIRWCVTTKNGDAAKFGEALEDAAEEVRAMMDRAKDAGGEQKAKL